MKRIFLLLVIVAVVVYCAVVWISVSNSVVFKGNFDWADYDYTYTPELSGKNVGEITDANAAAEIANKLWREVYGREFKGRITVRFNENNNCWLIEGSPSIQTVFDAHYFPAALIFADGTIKDCWLSQL